MTAIREKRQNLLMNEEENLERLKEHFEKVLNIDSAGTELPDDTGVVAAQQLPEKTAS